jgi:hypothetical protein
MKSIIRTLFALGIMFSSAAFAQKWEFGGGAGGGFYTSKNITSPTGEASAKFATNVTASAWLGNNSPSFLGGELRYDWQRGAAELKSGGTSASFNAQSHAIHYDVVLHLVTPESPVRPFVSAGGGVKAYQGTGTEVAFQPLSKVGLLTKATDLRPMISVAGGLKMKIRPGVGLRIEVHDFMTPFPEKVITPALNAKTGGWIHDFVVSFGLSFLFN